MTPWRTFLERPQQLWLRRALFQVHLWTGITLGLYVLLIGTTGAALVFREEIQEATEKPLVSKQEARGPLADILTVADQVLATHPGAKLTSVSGPNAENPTIIIRIRQGKEIVAVHAHPVTGKILGSVDAGTSFLRWLQMLHFNLLADRTGRIVNGVGAAFLLMLCISGMVIWWPGVKHWRRSLTVDFSKQWKRLTWDLHSATGFWAVAALSMWAITGIYFAWPTEFQKTVNWFSPVSLAQAPKPNIAMKGKLPPPDMRRLLADSLTRSPGARLLTLNWPNEARGQIRIILAREEPARSESADYHYYDPYTGEHAAVWHRGQNQTAGDLIMNWITPLHFGTFGGIWVKALWVLFGLAPPVLTITGFMIYWNRFLSKRFQ